LDDPIANWWKAFREQAPRLSGLFHREEEWDLPEWMEQNLSPIHPHLMWEFGPACRGPGHRLVITPESRRELRPLVREILRRAPQIEGWEFYDHRLAENLDDAAATVECRVGGDIRSLEVIVTLGDFNRVNLRFLGFPPDADLQHNSSVAFVAVESLLGEEVLDRWIGGIDVEPQPNADDERPFAIGDLRAKVEQLIQQIQDTLPEHPWHEIDVESVPWNALEIETEECDDCIRQNDLLVAISPLPGLVQNAMSGETFDSTRFSRCGEVFCYLKIDGSEGLDGSAFADRSEIEDAINAVLRPAKLGSSIGGGTGRRYSYVELALVDIDRAWQEMRLVLQEGHLTPRTWLLFHDDERRFDWMGLYDDSPEPLMPEPESEDD